MWRSARKGAAGLWFTASDRKTFEYFCFTGVKISPDTLQTVCSPLLLQGTEGFPESRADLIQQLNQRVAKDFGDCRFRVEVEGS